MIPSLSSDKKTATTFALVHRPQTDPLIHDPEASDMVFTKISEPAKKPEVQGITSTKRIIRCPTDSDDSRPHPRAVKSKPPPISKKHSEMKPQKSARTKEKPPNTEFTTMTPSTITCNICAKSPTPATPFF